VYSLVNIFELNQKKKQTPNAISVNLTIDDSGKEKLKLFWERFLSLLQLRLKENEALSKLTYTPKLLTMRYSIIGTILNPTVFKFDTVLFGVDIFGTDINIPLPVNELYWSVPLAKMVSLPNERKLKSPNIPIPNKVDLASLVMPFCEGIQVPVYEIEAPKEAIPKRYPTNGLKVKEEYFALTGK